METILSTGVVITHLMLCSMTLAGYPKGSVVWWAWHRDLLLSNSDGEVPSYLIKKRDHLRRRITAGIVYRTALSGEKHTLNYDGSDVLVPILEDDILVASVFESISFKPESTILSNQITYSKANEDMVIDKTNVGYVKAHDPIQFWLFSGLTEGINMLQRKTSLSEFVMSKNTIAGSVFIYYYVFFVLRLMHLYSVDYYPYISEMGVLNLMCATGILVFEARSGCGPIKYFMHDLSAFCIFILTPIIHLNYKSDLFHLSTALMMMSLGTLYVLIASRITKYYGHWINLKEGPWSDLILEEIPIWLEMLVMSLLVILVVA